MKGVQHKSNQHPRTKRKPTRPKIIFTSRKGPRQVAVRVTLDDNPLELYRLTTSGAEGWGITTRRSGGAETCIYYMENICFFGGGMVCVVCCCSSSRVVLNFPNLGGNKKIPVQIYYRREKKERRRRRKNQVTIARPLLTQ